MRPKNLPLISCALLVLAFLAAFGKVHCAAYTLDDFGYKHLLTSSGPLPRALPAGQRYCLVVLLDTAKTGAYPHPADWYQHTMFDFAQSPGYSVVPINSYFLENSSGRFTMSSTGAGPGGTGVMGPLTLSASEQQTYDNALINGATPGLVTTTIGQVAMSAAVRNGFPLANFDIDANGDVGNDELILVPVVNTVGLGAGQTLASVNVTPPGSATGAHLMVSAMSASAYDDRPATVAHELTHNVANMVDLYNGATAADGTHVDFNQRFSIAADFNQCHLDPYEKMTAGWIEPRLVDMHRGGRFYLKAAQLSDPTSPLLLYDNARGTHEFFLMEFRTRTLGGYDLDFLDRQAHEKGVVLWHIMTKENFDVYQNPVTLFGSTPDNDPPRTIRVEGPPYPSQNKYLQPDVVWDYGQLSSRLRWTGDPNFVVDLAPVSFQVEPYPGNDNGVWVDIIPEPVGDANWTGNAGSNGTGEWNVGGNWNGGVPPENYAATFGASGTTNIHIALKTFAAPGGFDLTPFGLHSITFAAGAPAYHLTLGSDLTYAGGNNWTGAIGSLDLFGAGVVNNSGVVQTITLSLAAEVVGANADTESFYAPPATLDFHNTASAGTLTAYDVPPGNVHFVSNPPFNGLLLRGPAGAMRFHDRATGGASAVQVRGGAGNGSNPSLLQFYDASTAGAATVTVGGGVPGPTFTDFTPNPCDGTGGQVYFYNAADAGTAHITTQGENNGTGGAGAAVIFNHQSNAANATITNIGGGYQGGYGGVMFFQDASNAGHAQIINSPPNAQGAGGSFTRFYNTSSAGNATISNAGSPTYGFTAGATTIFQHQTTADHATFNNGGAITFGAQGGEIDFRDTSTAASATFNNRRASNYGGVIKFYDQSTAASSTILNGVESMVDNGPYVVFYNDSTAGTATITNGLAGGGIEFHNQATASRPSPGHPRSNISLIGQADNNSRLTFFDTASAANASINMRGSLCNFSGHSTADQAAITLDSSAGLTFAGDATDGSVPRVSAGTASVLAYGGANDYGRAGIDFGNWTTADHASFLLNGGASGYYGADIVFRGNAQAANATIILNPAAPGGAGASCEFYDSATGDNARLEAYGGPYENGGAYFNFEYRYNSGVPLSVGSIAGDGGFYLRGAALTVGSLNTDTVVNGRLLDDTRTGGTLTKVGTGTLTLNGVNTYTGDTTVSQGALSVGGSIKGNVVVQNGATLKGSGNVLGTVTVNNGGTVAPGNSPGTLTVASAALSANAVLEIECGPTVTDRLVVTGDAQVGCLINVKLLPGATVAAFNREILTVAGTFNAAGLRIGSVPAGLSAADFSLAVANGHVFLQYAAGASSGSFSFFQAVNFTPAQQADPLVSGPTADPDRDGIPNAVEYALGLDPNVSGGTSPFVAGIKPSTTISGSPKVMTLSFSVPANPPSEGTLAIRQTASLTPPATWTILASRNSSGAWTTSNGGSVTLGATVNGRIPVTVFGSLPLSATSKAFLRPEATLP